MLLPSRYHQFDGGVRVEHRVDVVWMPCGAFSALRGGSMDLLVSGRTDRRPLVFDCFIVLCYMVLDDLGALIHRVSHT